MILTQNVAVLFRDGYYWGNVLDGSVRSLAGFSSSNE